MARKAARARASIDLRGDRYAMLTRAKIVPEAAKGDFESRLCVVVVGTGDVRPEMGGFPFSFHKKGMTSPLTLPVPMMQSLERKRERGRVGVI